MLKGVILDLDGIIVDTVPLHFQAWKKMFSEYQREFTFHDYKDKVDGILRIDGARAILKDIPEEELKIAAAKKETYFLEFLRQQGVKVFEDTLNLIKELKDNHIKVAVISSSKNCFYILRKAGIDNLFDVIITGNDIKRGKPQPDIFLLASKKLSLEPSQCIVFEDSFLGIEAAKRGNFKCVGVDRYQNPEALLIKADLVVNTLKEVNLEKLKALLGGF
jgi:beta-phosphoglucomutase